MTTLATEYQRYYSLLQTDNAKLMLFAELKKSKDSDVQKVLRDLVNKWLEEK